MHIQYTRNTTKRTRGQWGTHAPKLGPGKVQVRQRGGGVQGHAFGERRATAHTPDRVAHGGAAGEGD